MDVVALSVHGGRVGLSGGVVRIGIPCEYGLFRSALDFFGACPSRCRRPALAQ